MQTILIVDDEQDIREIISFNLEQADFHCMMAANGAEAFTMLANHPIDLILLDVMMPGLSGFDVARMIRNEQVPGTLFDVPIIFLTALGEEDDMLRGFNIGADDYITKPFSIKEVLARVEAVLRRKSISPSSNASLKAEAVAYDSLWLDATTYTGMIDNVDIGLTKMEYELLHFLLQHQGVVYSRSNLLWQVWPDNGLVLDRTVDVTITRLRKKLGVYKDNLKTKTGYGYYWEK